MLKNKDLAKFLMVSTNRHKKRVPQDKTDCKDIP